jgi:hypothetical protein
MALHCRCNNCAISVATGNSAGPTEQIAGAVLPLTAVGGIFAHYSGAARVTLYGREIFGFATGDNVGISGFYLSPGFVGARPGSIAQVLNIFGIGGGTTNDVPITALNRASIFKTRTGALVDGCELTMLIGCGGAVTVATGAIAAGVMGATVPCVAPLPAQPQRQRSKCLVM